MNVLMIGLNSKTNGEEFVFFWKNLGETIGYRQIEENSCLEELGFVFRTSKGDGDK